MTSTVGRYAQIPKGSNVVENTITMSADFTIDGYVFIEIETGVACEPGAFHNESDGLFYADSEFKSLSGTVSDTDSE